jgi:hypothetical protein
MKNLIYLIFVLPIILISCDCHIQQKGRILSNIDGQPIVNARINLKNTNTVVKTDSIGYFDLEYVGGGNCPKPIYTISKEGYKDFEIAFDYSSSENIIKVKKGDKNYDLKGKFFYPDSTNLSTYFVDIQFEKYSKDFSIKNDSLILYMDLDNTNIDFTNYLKMLKNGGWNIDKYKIK